MLTADLFEKIDYIARKLRYKPLRPFGGIQVIFSGDFFQLPPIGVSNGNNKFCFQANGWEQCFPKSQRRSLSTHPLGTYSTEICTRGYFLK